MVFFDYSIELLKEEMYGDIVLVEGESSVYTITKDLIEKGNKKIGFIGDITYCKTIYDRWVGYKRALFDFDIEVDYILTIPPANSTFEVSGEVMIDGTSFDGEGLTNEDFIYDILIAFF